MILKQIHSIDGFCLMAESHHGVFASKEWLSIYQDNLTLVGIYKDEHQLVGGFYFLKTKRKGFTFIKLPPYTPHCALFFKSEASNASSALNFQKEILEKVTIFLKSQNATLIVLALPSIITDTQPFIWDNYKVIPNYTYRIDLTQTIDQIKSQFDSKNRNAINKAIKEDIVVELNTLSVHELYEFFSGHLKSAGANVYHSELKQIFTKFASHDNSFCFTAKKNGVVLGNVFCIYDNKVCYYLLGGVDRASGIQGINNLLMLKSIERAKLQGCEIFDFEGSMIKGVEKFFRSFGPTLHSYYTLNKGQLWLELLLKFKKRSIF
jgi:lipid II:glycine glycyltransferase (peptidoglycan interpeptide bridge formation enzyme)